MTKEVSEKLCIYEKTYLAQTGVSYNVAWPLQPPYTQSTAEKKKKEISKTIANDRARKIIETLSTLKTPQLFLVLLIWSELTSFSSKCPCFGQAESGQLIAVSRPSLMSSSTYCFKHCKRQILIFFVFQKIMRQLLPVVMLPPTNALLIVVKPNLDHHSIQELLVKQANLAQIKTLNLYYIYL